MNLNMKKPNRNYSFLRIVLIFSFTLAIIPIAEAAKANPKGRKIIDKYLEVQDVDSELAFIRMNTYIPSGSESINKKQRFLAITKKNKTGTNSFMIRMVRPKNVEGVTFLANSNTDDTVNHYIYLPEIGNVTRIRSASKSGAFLGSDFTYEDLQREIPSNFKYERLSDQVVHGAECFTVRALPASDSVESYYSHRDLFIEKKTYNLYKIDFYKAGGKLVKILETYEYGSSKVKGETVRPLDAVMTNKEKNTVTVFTVVESRLNLELEKELFTPEKIKQWTADEVRQLIFDVGFTFTVEPIP
jgi:hypothetical protein